MHGETILQRHEVLKKTIMLTLDGSKEAQYCVCSSSSTKDDEGVRIFRGPILGVSEASVDA